MDEEATFTAALELTRPDERRAFLVEACGGDVQSLARLEALLRAHENPDRFLNPPVPPVSPSGEGCCEGPGTVIGSYKLLEQIGEGGFGVVFRAEQQQPVRREVALKIIKPGMDSRHVIARFEAERQTLALMDHPNIARVFDGGQTASGRPYFVMELVKGLSIIDYCDQHHRTIRERLELFITVCRAVQHAHQKGIIHRDLKPSNVMVSASDGVPAIKVIDFGIAKATSPQLTDRTQLTSAAQFVGTPMYVSPEQAQLGGVDVDTRADVYALGVMLYELLTGMTPFDAERLRSATYDEIRRIIREEEPPRPSTRLSSLGERTTVVSANRRCDPRRLRQFLRDELDWIVMKCLEKDRERRYDTATGLARDVERYLNDEPVQACAPSISYRLQKFLRRNRGSVLAASLVLTLLVVGIVGTTWGMLRAKDAESTAVAETKEKETALEEARQSERKAKEQYRRSLLSQAHALRISGQAGQRFESLKLLAEAARSARAQCLGEEEIQKLRNEAIACLALPDVRFKRTLLDQNKEKVPHVYWLALDPDFRFFAFSDKEGTIHVRRVADGVETTRLPGPDVARGWVGLRFSPDGQWLLIHHHWDDRVSENVLWEFRDGKLGRKVALDHDCDFSPDSRFIAGGRTDGAIGIYELPSGREVKRIAEGMDVAEVKYHPDGRQLAVWFWGKKDKEKKKQVVVMDLETGKEVARYPLREELDGRVSWSSDGRLLAVPCADQRIYVWDHQRQRQQSMLDGHSSLGINLSFVPVTNGLLTTSWDGSMLLWDPISGRQRLSMARAGTGFVHVRRDGREVILGNGSGVLEVWELEDGVECRTVHHGMVGNRTDRPYHWGPTGWDVSQDGRLLVSSGVDGTRLWDLETLTELDRLPARATLNVRFHPEGSSLFTYETGGVFRWPIQRDVKPTPDHPGGVEFLQVGPPQSLELPGNRECPFLNVDRRGRWLNVVDFGRSRAILIDLNDLNRRLILESPRLNACALSPDGQWAATWGNGKDNAIKMWETSTGKCQWQAPAGENYSHFSSDGRWLVTTRGGSGARRYWELATWETGTTLPGSPGRSPLSPAPDGSLLATPAAPLMLLHPTTGRELATLEAPRGSNNQTIVRFTPDSRRLMTGTGNHTIHVWDLPALRRGLVEVGLDWDLPSYPPPAPKGPSRLIRCIVHPMTAGK
jgi:serine/threonine protein kinase/WD40 repeat protein